MIPYFSWQTITLGPLTLQVWGIFVALGILIGATVGARFWQKLGGTKDLFYQIAFWLILGAFIGARLVHVFIYEPAYYLANPGQILQFWQGGFAITGGFLGAIIAYAICVHYYKIAWLKYADAFIYGLPLGIGCGRIGCFLIHDHPGTATDFFLGVRYPDGLVRHDHGLYLSLNGFVLALVFYYLAKKPRSAGFFARVFLIWDGSTRFLLDFWRAVDVRYLSLTPAQYASLLMVVGGVGWWYYTYKSAKSVKNYES